MVLSLTRQSSMLLLALFVSSLSANLTYPPRSFPVVAHMGQREQLLGAMGLVLCCH